MNLLPNQVWTSLTSTDSNTPPWKGSLLAPAQPVCIHQITSCVLSSSHCQVSLILLFLRPMELSKLGMHGPVETNSSQIHQSLFPLTFQYSNPLECHHSSMYRVPWLYTCWNMECLTPFLLANPFTHSTNIYWMFDAQTQNKIEPASLAGVRDRQVNQYDAVGWEQQRYAVLSGLWTIMGCG